MIFDFSIPDGSRARTVHLWYDLGKVQSRYRQGDDVQK